MQVPGVRGARARWRLRQVQCHRAPHRDAWTPGLLEPDAALKGEVVKGGALETGQRLLDNLLEMMPLNPWTPESKAANLTPWTPGLVNQSLDS